MVGEAVGGASSSKVGPCASTRRCVGDAAGEK